MTEKDWPELTDDNTERLFLEELGPVDENTSAMLTRQMLKLKARRRKKAIIGLPNDISRDGEFPSKYESAEERNEDLKFWLKYLSDVRAAKMEGIISQVRASLRQKRLGGRNGKWWKHHYAKLLGISEEELDE